MRVLISTLILVGTLTGCGQKGPLTITQDIGPKDPPVAEQDTKDAENKQDKRQTNE
ncbi:MAG: hypothetical protein JKY66_10790 [Spongiibacteraceae bacterium]|nr:hypothetical protein [Spongiibacteraceae bacterium]